MRICRRVSRPPNSHPSKTHFFKAIVHYRQLEIPVGFVRKFGEQLSDTAVLKVPNGKEWVVELKKIDGVVWFHNGWQEFLKYHNISIGYFVVFRYDGDSNFFVLIFNHYACEIKYSLQESKCLMLENEERGEEEEHEEEEDTLASLRKKIIDGHKEKQTTETKSKPSVQRVKKQGMTTSANSGSPGSKPECLAQKKRKRKRNETVSRKRTKPNASAEEVFKKFDFPQTAQTSGIPPSPPPQSLGNEYEWAFLRKERPVTEKERKGAICAARSLKNKRPSFMVIMKPSYLRKGLNVPLVFARTHFTEGEHVVKLWLPNGRTWSARLFLRCSIKALLSSGWNAFARENVLLEGDCCVFEVFKKKVIEMKVSIFRVVDDWVPLVGSVIGKTRTPTKFQETNASQAANEFKSECPFFIICMHQSYAQNKCGVVIKAEFVKSHLKDVKTVTLKNSDGRKWSVRCVINGGQGRLGRGWAEFANENNVEQGDFCAFELIKKKGTVLKVSIFKNH